MLELSAAPKRVAGLVTEQLIDTIANIDARLQLLARARIYAPHSAVCEVAMTSRALESYFSTLAATAGSSHKLDAIGIQQRLIHLDVSQLVKQRHHEGFTTYTSKKRTRLAEVRRPDYNDGTSTLKDDEQWFAEVRKVARSFTTNRSSIRDHNAHKGGLRS